MFSIYGHGGHLGHVAWTIDINLLIPTSHKGSTYILALIGQEVSEEKTFDIVNGRRLTDDNDDGSCVSISLPMSLGADKRKVKLTYKFAENPGCGAFNIKLILVCRRDVSNPSHHV